MGLISWWRRRKQIKLEKKLKEEKEDKERARKRFRYIYLMNKGLDQDRDFLFVDKLITLAGDKYLKEAELLLSSTGNGEYISDKITNEDIPKLVENIMKYMSDQYKLILCIYLGDEDAIMRYVILKLNEYIVRIMLMNRHKINSMNPEYRKLQQVLSAASKQKEDINQQRKQ